jgi:hypothetical protein
MMKKISLSSRENLDWKTVISRVSGSRVDFLDD